VLGRFGATAFIVGFAAVGAAQERADPPLRAPGTDLRVVVWNVYGFPDRNPERLRRDAFAKIFHTLDPDLLLLNEVNGSTDDVIDVLPQDRGCWSVVRDGELLAAVRGSRRIALAFDRPRLPRAANFLQQLMEWIIGPRRATAIGAMVHDGKRTILVVPVHLPCCGNESGRLRDARAIGEAVTRAHAASRADAIIIGGDFNTVRGLAPIDTVRDAVATTPARLHMVDARHLDGRSDATWRDDRSAFPPARLDWLLHTDDAVTALRSFVFDTAPLGVNASDHLPVVADFRWR
jgi:endonuclease/exonuclease/phosphatase family metal-dependent hydrolase